MDIGVGQGCMSMLPIVGREPELAEISRAFAQRGPRVVSISGLHGVGKSTLLGCAIQEAARCGVPTLAVNSGAASVPSDEALVSFLRRVVYGVAFGSRLDFSSLRRQLEKYEDVRREVLARFTGKEREVGEILNAGLGAVRLSVGAATGGTLPVPIVSPELVADIVRVVHEHTNKRRHRLLYDPGFYLGEEFVQCIRKSAGTGHRIAITIDEYEHVGCEVDAWLRRLQAGAFGALPDRTVTFIAGRLPLREEWRATGALAAEVTTIELKELAPDAVEQYLRAALEPVGRAADAARAAALLGRLGRLPALLQQAASDPHGLAAQLGTSTRPRAGGYDWGGAFEEYVRRIAEPGLTEQNRWALHALAFPRRLDDRRLQVALGAAGVDRPAQFLTLLQRRDLFDPNPPSFRMYEPIRRVLSNNLRQHDPALARSVHLALADHFHGHSRPPADPAGLAEAFREHIYHQVLAGDGVLPLTRCLQGIVDRLPHVYQELPRWITMVQEVQTSAPDIPLRDQDDLERLAHLLVTAWDLLALAEAEAVEDAISLKSDPLLYRLLQLDRPRITDECSRLWLELFSITAGRLSRETSVSLVDAENMLRSLRGECASVLPGEEHGLLRFCVVYELAEVSYLQGHIDEAVSLSRSLVEMARDQGLPLLRALAYANLGSNLKRMSEFHTATAEFEHSINWFKRLPGNWSSHVRSVQLELANCHLYLGESAIAMGLIGRLTGSPVDQRGAAELHHRHGWQLRLQGDLAGSVREHRVAIDAYDRLLTDLRPSSDMARSIATLRAKAQHSLANTLSEMHDFPGAGALYAESIGHFESHGLGRHAGIALKDSIPLEFAVRGLAAATDAYRRALARMTREGATTMANANHIAEAHLLFARAASLARETAQASDALRRARDILNKLEPGARNQLEARWNLERALVATQCEDYTAARERVRDVEAYAERSMPPRYDLLAQAAALRAVATARTRTLESGLIVLRDAHTVAGRWNSYLAMEVDHIWSTVSREPVTPPSGEILDVFDEHGARIGTEPSVDVHRNGSWHRAFHCWVTDRDPRHPSALFQRRGAGKRDFPNRLDISVAGHYRAGEQVEGGLREAREELGLVVKESDIVRIAERRVDERLYNGTLNRERQDIYWLSRTHLDLTDLRIGYPEVEAAVLCPIDSVELLLRGDVGSIKVRSLSGRPGAGGRVVEIEVTSDDFIAEARHYLIEVCALLRAKITGSRAGGDDGERILPDNSAWRPTSG